LERIKAILFRIFYYLYFLFVGHHLIKRPTVVTPQGYYLCEYLYCEGKTEKEKKDKRHHHFLLVSTKSFQPEKKWNFHKNSFAYRVKGSSYWIALPSLALWKSDDSDFYKYGLNTTFVKIYGKLISEFEFCIW